MKKFLMTLFILSALGGTGFFFGWTQFWVPPGAFGVINSKTHGVDQTLVRSGEFRWLWYKLIPTNAKTAVFHLEPASFSINFNSSLPSGESYASFAGLGADFSWNIRATISFNINPDSLISLVEKHNIMNQEALDAYLNDIANNIELMILRTLSSGDIGSERLERILAGNPDAAMEQEVLRRYPEIRDFAFTIQSARFPDFQLYRFVRLLYEEFLEKQRETVYDSLGRRAESHIASQLRFSELERFGELLTRFPVLLEYLVLEQNIKNEQ
jgi:hypothetical protein